MFASLYCMCSYGETYTVIVYKVCTYVYVAVMLLKHVSTVESLLKDTLKKDIRNTFNLSVNFVVPTVDNYTSKKQKSKTSL